METSVAGKFTHELRRERHVVGNQCQGFTVNSDFSTMMTDNADLSVSNATNGNFEK
jgi:hypothetical protein